MNKNILFFAGIFVLLVLVANVSGFNYDDESKKYILNGASFDEISIPCAGLAGNDHFRIIGDNQPIVEDALSLGEEYRNKIAWKLFGRGFSTSQQPKGTIIGVELNNEGGGGLYSPADSSDRIFNRVWIQGSNSDKLRENLFHEMAHDAIEAFYPTGSKQTTSPWFKEGIAIGFSAGKYSEVKAQLLNEIEKIKQNPGLVNKANFDTLLYGSISTPSQYALSNSLLAYLFYLKEGQKNERNALDSLFKFVDASRDTNNPFNYQKNNYANGLKVIFRNNFRDPVLDTETLRRWWLEWIKTTDNPLLILDVKDVNPPKRKPGALTCPSVSGNDYFSAFTSTSEGDSCTAAFVIEYATRVRNAISMDLFKNILPSSKKADLSFEIPKNLKEYKDLMSDFLPMHFPKSGGYMAALNIGYLKEQLNYIVARILFSDSYNFPPWLETGMAASYFNGDIKKHMNDEIDSLSKQNDIVVKPEFVNIFNKFIGQVDSNDGKGYNTPTREYAISNSVVNYLLFISNQDKNRLFVFGNVLKQGTLLNKALQDYYGIQDLDDLYSGWKTFIQMKESEEKKLKKIYYNEVFLPPDINMDDYKCPRNPLAPGKPPSEDKTTYDNPHQTYTPITPGETQGTIIIPSNNPECFASTVETGKETQNEQIGNCPLSLKTRLSPNLPYNIKISNMNDFDADSEVLCYLPNKELINIAIPGVMKDKSYICKGDDFSRFCSNSQVCTKTEEGFPYCPNPEPFGGQEFGEGQILVADNYGQEFDVKTLSAFLVREKDNFNLDGIALVVRPSVNFSKSIRIFVNYSYFNGEDLQTYKYSDHEAVLDSCTTTLLNSISKEIDSNGGIINLNDKMIINIPSDSVNEKIDFTIEEYNLKNCFSPGTEIIKEYPKQVNMFFYYFISVLLIACFGFIFLFYKIVRMKR